MTIHLEMLIADSRSQQPKAIDTATLSKSDYKHHERSHPRIGHQTSHRALSLPRGERVRTTFYSGASLSSVLMLAMTLLCQFQGPGLIRLFSHDPAVMGFGSEYLRIISWNFVASGLAFVASSMFQAMGHTLPSLVSSSSRLVLFAAPALVFSARSDFQIRQVWYLSLASVFVQATLALLLLRREFKRRLDFPADAPMPPVVEANTLSAEA